MPVFLSTGGDSINWTRIKHEIIRIFPFFIIFLLNNFLLFRYFKNKKYLIYSVFTIIVVVAFSFVASLNVEIFRLFDIPRPQMPRPQMPGPKMPGPQMPPLHQKVNFSMEFFNKFFY
ncbi:MAG: hypothetical protein PHW82_05595, partial [Bacteroidales bacterium]|nr:hypothetical protein [Bacteroidales bacterium]